MRKLDIKAVRLNSFPIPSKVVMKIDQDLQLLKTNFNLAIDRLENLIHPDGVG
jgi:hypothetical protein